MANCIRERGSALVLVLISSVIFTILIGAVFTLFKMNVESHFWIREKLQARYTAEAGANLAVHMIMGGEDVPQGDSARPFLPDSAGAWFELPGDDLREVQVWVDPCKENEKVLDANSYQLRVLGRIPGGGLSAFQMHAMSTIIIPENFARFAAFQDDPPAGYYYGDGYRFDGPFFSNGPVRIESSSVGRDNDPFFYSLTTPAGYYIHGGAHVVVPHINQLWIEPYERMQLGSPYFDLNADSIPFGPDELNWQAARNAAMNGGLYFDVTEVPNGTRVALKLDTLMWRTADGSVTNKVWLDTLEKPVIWFDNNAADHICFRGIAATEGSRFNGLSVPLTIGCNGDVRIIGPHLYQNGDPEDPDNKILLGFMTIFGEFAIADDPGAAMEPGWGEFQIITEEYSGGSLEFDGVFLSLSGVLRAEKPWEPNPGTSFTIVGGYILVAEGWTSMADHRGYEICIYYDTRLMSMHPPFFPQTGRWQTLVWDDDEDFDESNIGQIFY